MKQQMQKSAFIKAFQHLVHKRVFRRQDSQISFASQTGCWFDNESKADHFESMVRNELKTYGVCRPTIEITGVKSNLGTGSWLPLCRQMLTMFPFTSSSSITPWVPVPVYRVLKYIYFFQQFVLSLLIQCQFKILSEFSSRY